MKLSDEYQYYILCEDAQMQTFLVSFLKCHRINSHKIRPIPIPAGQGCGEAHVRRRFPLEVKFMRQNNYLRIALIVCVDADRLTVDSRKEKLFDELGLEFEKKDVAKEPIVIWIPKREIETWIHFFRGETVDENMSFIHDGRPCSCKEEAAKMYALCTRDSINDITCLPSLIAAKAEYERVCALQQK